MGLDEIIEEIVFMIFEAEVDLEDPSETIQQIKNKLKNTWQIGQKSL